ncbi:hypothetical protein DL98DRAFT_441636, partial [Cadophora sp. DSE1049]
VEYCKGIMFLTTNRVSQFDPAILSRIHLMLRYDNLSKDARSEIWGQFLSRAATPCGDVDIKDHELERLVSSELNGRQVMLPYIPLTARNTWWRAWTTEAAAI